jgi:biotin carboxylase
VVLRDGDDLAAAFPAWPPGHASLLVQRYAPGRRHNIHFAAREGRILARAETTALRTDRRDGSGLGVEGISVPLHEALNHDADRLVAVLEYTGVGLIQYLVPHDGPPHLLEMNPRLGTALAFIQHLGLDLARAACALATGDPVWSPDPSYRHAVGRRYVWTSKDLNGLIVSRDQGRLAPGEGARWVRRLLRAALRADAHLTWSWRDPRPSIELARTLLSATMRRSGR